MNGTDSDRAIPERRRRVKLLNLRVVLVGIIATELLAWWLLRQELIRLDLTTNWEDANLILFDLHKHLWSEVFYLPLWELDRYSISRRNLGGIPSRPLQAYDQLGSWTVDPWFEQNQP